MASLNVIVNIRPNVVHRAIGRVVARKVKSSTLRYEHNKTKKEEKETSNKICKYTYRHNQSVEFTPFRIWRPAEK